jgi:hypothetical protein
LKEAYTWLEVRSDGRLIPNKKQRNSLHFLKVNIFPHTLNKTRQCSDPALVIYLNEGSKSKAVGNEP